MANMMQTGVNWLKSQLKTAAGHSINYRRPGVTTFPRLTAIVGRTTFRLSDPNGQSRLEWGDRDYLIDSADLAGLGDPKEGDQIEDLDEDRTYEVQSPSNGEQAFRPSDQLGGQLRIHTRRVK